MTTNECNSLCGQHCLPGSFIPESSSRKLYPQGAERMSSESSRGLIHLGSPYTVSETIARLAGIGSSKGLTVLARIDHSGDAARAGLELYPTELLIFGCSKAGTPLMLSSPTAA